jgi:hypothetical protein
MQTAKPVRQIIPAQPKETADNRPNDIRFGWCPFQDIRMQGPTGGLTLYVQPHEIQGPDGETIDNPFHFVLPKSQLIPFITFPAVEYVISDTVRDSAGLPKAIPTTRAATALENIVSVLRFYSGWGFTVLHALQGMNDAFQTDRLFRIVHPFEYDLKDLESELEFGALDRIAQTEPISYDMGPDEDPYTIFPLQDGEHAIARALAEQMLAGASVARAYAEDLFNRSMMSINEKLSGGNGKAGPDELDKYLARQLGREGEIPSLANRNGQKPQPDTAMLEKKIDVLVADLQARKDAEKISELQAALDEVQAERDRLLGSARPGAADDEADDDGAVKVEYAECGYPKAAGGNCKRRVVKGTLCAEHEEEANAGV